ncbi:uncharacterized protein SETTUDRAFT_37154 [Exserohilum turcica Et28A]|uniref:Amidohydrolase 3 domain-containing protein n=1 Tax=Exserohilum turcicum (strain 28A) TaxID=671987 RepID=R0KN66_EXST2|nr:uncharacterized protein SETTUDRAFT_37154 [Exserohilum turcica Et28A]EOA90519.1 hypothetical protein SETTUDRAFT_37154 [Exserohilum turcica Et28A]
MNPPDFFSSKGPENSVAFIDGRVYTMNQAQPWAEAFIVNSKGVFEAVGSNAEIKAIAKKRRLIQYQLKSKFVMPGIHDAHTHLPCGSMQRLGEAHIGFNSSSNNMAHDLEHAGCACAYSNVMGDWIIGNFYSSENFPDGIPDRKYLDEKYPDVPVMVREVSCHRVLLNTTGLKRVGLNRDSQAPHGGSLPRRPDGELTGEVIEGAIGMVFLALPRTLLGYVKTALEFAISECHRYGITSVQEASANTLYLHAVKELESENRLPLDISTHIVCAPEGPALEPRERLAALLNVAEAFESEHVHSDFVKLFLDGAPLPPNSTQSDLDENGKPDETHLNLTFNELLDYLVQYDAKGMTCKVHVAGEGSVRRALEVMEELRKRNPNGPQHELAHCNAVHPDDIARFAPARLTAEMSPAIWHFPIAATTPKLFKWPFNEMLATGAKLTIGSDWILTLNPSLFDALAHLVERIQGPNMPKPDKKAAGELLCRIITMGGAEAVGRSHIQGSIEVGKKANFIAVDRDLSAGEFAGANVLKTWFEGRQVYSSVAGEMAIA